MKASFTLRVLFCKICILFPLFCFSQGEFNNWYFCHHAGVTFNSGVPVALEDCSTIFWQRFASCTVSDSLGNLLFYSDGYRVFNRTHHKMPNGDDLNPYGGWQTQILFAVPSLQDSNLFFLFTVGDYNSDDGLRYSIISMQLDGGLGDIPTGLKNIPIASSWDVRQAVTGTRHHNNRFVWVVARKHNNSSLYASYLINDTGLDTTVVFSNSLIPIVVDSIGLYSAYTLSIKISPDGNKLIATYTNSTDANSRLMEVCNFNSQTGQITPLFTTHVNLRDDQGILEFSRDSKYLFLVESGGPDINEGQIIQFDATKTDFLAFVQSKVIIATIYISSGLQMAPDNKIYCTEQDSAFLHVINNPSGYGIECNFQRHAVDLLGNTAMWGFPQFLQRYYVYINHSGQCQYDSVTFSAILYPPADSLHWDFGDPGSGDFNFSDLPKPYHMYFSPGTYTVTLFVRHYDNRMDTAWQIVTILPSPHPDLGEDRTICIGDSVTFDAGYWEGCTYLWSNLTTGQLNIGTQQTITTSQAAEYMVKVTGSNNCYGSDTVVLSTTPVPAVTNSPLLKEICSGESTDILLTSNVPGATFNWTATLVSGNITGFTADSGFMITQVLVNHDPSPGMVTYHITPKVGSCIGTPSDYAVTVNPVDSVNIFITASENNVCTGAWVTFNAAPVNGGINPVYQWKVNENDVGTNNPTYIYAPVNNDLVSCILTSSNTVCITNNPATSDSITMVVNPNLPVSVSVSPSANPVCMGTTVTFTATPTNGGSNPQYQWKVNGNDAGTNSPVFTFITVNGDQV